MNILLWILQILLALLFLFAGGIKLIIPPDKLQAQAPPGAIHFPGWFLIFIGACEVLGGLGLVLPGLFRIRKGLTAVAAAGLAIIMLGAVVTGIMGEGVKAAIVPFIVGLLCAFVAYERGFQHR